MSVLPPPGFDFTPTRCAFVGCPSQDFDPAPLKARYWVGHWDLGVVEQEVELLVCKLHGASVRLLIPETEPGT